MMRKSLNDLEAKQAQELHDAKAHNSHEPPKRDRSIKDLAKLKSNLDHQKEKMEKVSRTYDELAATDASNEAQDQALLTQISAAKSKVLKLEKLKVRLPPAGSIILQLEDLECVSTSLRKFIDKRSSQIPQAESQIEALTSENQLKIAEVLRLEADVESQRAANDALRNQVSDVFIDLQKLGSSLQKVNSDAKTETDRANLERKSSEDFVASSEKHLETLRHRVEECRSDIERFPDHIRHAQDNNATLVSKKKTMIEQLRKKLTEIRQERMEKQASMPVVREFTEELEKEWLRCQKLLDTLRKKEKERDRLKEELARKDIAISEIKTKWPQSGTSGKTGIAELEYVYDQASAENRKLGDELRAVKSDVLVLEEIQKTLLGAV
jgi:chromosome segregation ATPase